MSFLLIYAPLLLAYATALSWCATLWSDLDGYHAHGWLLVGVMAWFGLRRRAGSDRVPSLPDQRGFWLLGPALLLHLVGALLTIDSLSAASLVLAVPGAAWLAEGRARLRGSWPVLWLPLVAVPTPLFVSGRLAFELKEVAMRGGLWLAQATGLQPVRQGAQLSLPGQPGALEVADACGGLRSLLAMLALAYVVAFFAGPRQGFRRALLLVVAGPLAVAVNMVRIAAICHAAHLGGVAFASGRGHDLANLLAWTVDLGLLFALGAWLARGEPVRASPAPVFAPAAVPASRRGPALLLWALAVPLLLLSLYRPPGESTGRADGLPKFVAGCTEQQRYAIEDRWYGLLGTRDVTWRRFTDEADKNLYVVAVFHAANWKSVHPPHICLEGSDMTIVEDGLARLPDGSEVGRILLRDNADGRPYLSLFAYGGRRLRTGSYASFFWHHLPRALVRATEPGFLLRVETYADDGVAAAETRCRTLLAALLDRCTEALR